MADGTPPDIEVTMTFDEAEKFRNDLKECDAEESVSFDNVTQAVDGGGAQLTFIIPGDEAGDNSDLLPELEEFIESINNKTLNEMEDS